nr:venom protein U-MPTX.17-Mc32 [Megalopyge crispata]
MLLLSLALIALFSNTKGEVVSVPLVKLHDGHEMPALALGTWLGKNGKPTGNEVEQAVLWAIESGYKHIDTAYIYGIEDQVGRALTKKLGEGLKREDIFITTKLWNSFHAREAVVPALRNSLKSLNLEYVDLYLIHWPLGEYPNRTLEYTDYLDTWKGMIEAKSLGLTKSIGVSNFNQQMIERILQNGLEKPVALQIELNLNLQQPELLSYCKKNDIVPMAYTPFGSLFYNKASADAPPPRIDTPELVEVARAHNKTVPQVALRYLLNLGAVPLPKSVTKARIEQNLDVFDFQLSPQETELLRSYDKHFRTIPQIKWRDHPYYPFEKN